MDHAAALRRILKFHHNHWDQPPRGPLYTQSALGEASGKFESRMHAEILL